MKLVSIAPDMRLGIWLDDAVVDTSAAGIAGMPGAMADALKGGAAALDSLRNLAADPPEAALLSADQVTLGPCVPQPGKILCVGLNYAKHAAEGGQAIPETPVLFSKFNNSLAGPDEDVPLPASAVEYDYEVELTAVVGRTTRDVSVEDALDHVVGYCCSNDISARDLQMLTGQWLLGKTLDKFLPLGPWLVTSDEVPDPQALGLRCWLNDELRQDSNTSDMIFSVAEIVSYASRYMTLEAGDVISTGTPEGVIMGMDPRVWMKAGDVVSVEVDGLGRLTNRLVEL
ncbi:MAG: fumarylacetoacetate hydrolase family protein [Anaerolineaceae bacterium]|nr:fumarylacetoacetate hydrolase family protein [Anaerolineaceae bacterium]MCY3908246.1 fumarylacetoacetate hydrolase family protein [Anaerolineaceae bacterium]